jgi:hypothetical protein
MELHVFKCTADESVFGFTPDIMGANLPVNVCQGKWEFWKTVEIESGVSSMGDILNEIINGVKAIGFHIASDGLQIGKL